MTPERWAQVRMVFERATALVAEARDSYLRVACQGDPELLLEVQSLLRSDAQAGQDFLAKPAVDLRAAVELDARFKPGTRIGAYQLLELIGQGGMGEVYRAARADGQYQSLVAIKLMRRGVDSAMIAERFRHERQILAGLEHPNIARLLDGGTTASGTPFLVMELVAGSQIDQYCDAKHLTIAERLRLFQRVCAAVQYAHQHLVIHRDIKPSNILVTDSGEPKLLDFGISRLLDPAANTELTILNALTLEYASPEQFKGGPITTASDVYSLGVVLFHLLTGHSPYAGNTHSAHELVRAVCDSEPRPPSSLVTGRSLAGDLDNIVLMALRKEPLRRYASVEQFSADIRRHLEQMPVMATPGSWQYRVGKFGRRHKLGVIATTIVLLATIGGVWSTIREARIATANQLRAEKRFSDVRKLAHLLIFDIHDAVINLPGSTPARKLIVDGALVYLDDLARESGADRSLQAELAEGYERVGLVQGGEPGRGNLGDTRGALASFQKMLAIRQQLVRADPTQLNHQIALARSYRTIADLQLIYLGEVNNALVNCRRAVAITEPLYRARPEDTGLAFELAADYHKLGDIEGGGNGSLSSRANISSSLAYHLKSLAVFRAMLKRAPTDKRYQRDVAVLDFTLQNNQLALGDRTGATNGAREALGIFAALATEKDNALAQLDLATGGYGAMGNLSLRYGDFSDAADYYRKGVQLIEPVVKADPQDVDARDALNSMRASLGLSLTRAGRRVEGLALLDESHADATNLIKTAENVQYQLSAAAIGLELAAALESAGEYSRARQHYLQAADTYQAILVAEPANIENAIAQSVALNGMAATDLRRRNHGAARDEFAQALKINEPLAAGNADALYAVAATYMGLGNLALATTTVMTAADQRLQQRQQASAWYRKSLVAARRIPNLSPVDPWGLDSVDVQLIASRLAESEKNPAAP